MYLQLIDKDNFKSVILYIHSDTDEFLKVIDAWKDELLNYARQEQEHNGVGFPLSRLEVDTCIVDLLRVLTEYYVKTSAFIKPHTGRIMATMRLLNESDLTNADMGRVKKINLSL